MEGGRLVRRFGSHVEVAAPEGLAIPAGGAWELVLDGLTHAPTNRTQGAMAAWVETAAGPIPVAVGDLQPPPGTGPAPPPAAPAGEIALPLALLPWPAAVEVGAFGRAPVLHPAEGSDPAPFAAVAALHRRLFPAAPGPLAAGPVANGCPVTTQRDPALPPGGYALAFGGPVVLAHADADGRRHGLVALAQMAHAARTDARFALPREGRIADRPRHAWRGAHLDAARNFRRAPEVARLIDVLAWHRMNRLHLHLTDDEGWRLPIAAHPQLTEVGAVRGRGRPLPPQFADGPAGQEGHYTAAELRALVAHGHALGVEIVPEIDVPGHATALLAALPELRDPEEAPGLYRSVQGYADNALNPGIERTYAVLETILRETADLFPAPVIHLGGDEVPPGAWGGSPAARALAAREGLAGTAALQSHFLRRMQGILRGLGRSTGGWDECAEGGGVEPEGALLFAWRDAGRTAALVAAGYDVVACPGEAYYLDMADRPGWDAAGTSWAGAVTLETTYRFEIGAPEGPGRLLGVQACLWSEHLDTPARLDAAACPRLSAVAEAAWTPPEVKSWPRFAALAPLMPRL